MASGFYVSLLLAAVVILYWKLGYGPEQKPDNQLKRIQENGQMTNLPVSRPRDWRTEGRTLGTQQKLTLTIKYKQQRQRQQQQQQKQQRQKVQELGLYD